MDGFKNDGTMSEEEFLDTYGMEEVDVDYNDEREDAKDLYGYDIDEEEWDEDFDWDELEEGIESEDEKK